MERVEVRVFLLEWTQRRTYSCCLVTMYRKLLVLEPIPKQKITAIYDVHQAMATTHFNYHFYTRNSIFHLSFTMFSVHRVIVTIRHYFYGTRKNRGKLSFRRPNFWYFTITPEPKRIRFSANDTLLKSLHNFKVSLQFADFF